MRSNKRLYKSALPLLIAVLMLLMAFGSAVEITAQHHPRAADNRGPTVPLDPTLIPQWENQLKRPPPVYVHDPGKQNSYTVEMTQFRERVLPPSMGKMTTTWGYAGFAKDAITGKRLGFVRSSPGPTFETKEGTPITVKWVNEIRSPSLFAVDPTIHWANPNTMPTPTLPFLPFPPGYTHAQSPVPLVTHVHGLEVQSTSDGGPLAWFTANGKHGPGYSTLRPTAPNAAIYRYPNSQPPTTLFYHDHALGITRLNLASGLAGFYLERQDFPYDRLADKLPSGKYEMPLVIQDRNFSTDGSFSFPNVGDHPDIHPYWAAEFFGNTIMVNGKVWPNMNVARGQYRFRIVDGSNARFYTMSFSNGMPFTQIGCDGGYLRAPVTLTTLTMGPSERADILVDFSNLAPGTKVILENSARAPFPSGDPVNPSTTGQIMQFTVTNKRGRAPAELPPILNLQLIKFPSLRHPSKIRIRTLAFVENSNSYAALLDGQMWDAPVSEVAKLGTTEQWIIPNLTGATHPIHIHLVQWQIVSRTPFDATRYKADWLKLNGGQLPFTHPTIPLSPAKYLTGEPRGADKNEQGWKDTVRMNPSEVTVVRARFAPIDGTRFYPFDARVGPGYVWHCHIVDHEDNEMMRPLDVV